MNEILTFREFLDAYNKVKPVLYYATSEDNKPGEIYRIKESEFHPEFIVCHPDDLQEISTKLVDRRLVHLKDEPMEDVFTRMLRSLDNRL